MIYLLAGTVSSVAEDFLVLDVNGVGYQVFAASRTLAQYQEGTAARLFIYTHVREDHIHLYGFATEDERRLFLKLTDVSGVGAKMGLSLLSALSPEELQNAVAGGDVTMLTRANGVGKKLAERIVLELKGKLGGFVVSGGGATSGIRLATTGHDDVLSALVNMGFKTTQAQQALAAAVQQVGDGGEFGPLLKASLQALRS